jgi:prepilin-type N-terminal cleavage/methylation domain-containing protein
MNHGAHGYILVELLVAIAVTSIVLAGTYAAYTFFAQQQQTLLAQTEVDHNALRAIDLI